MKLDSKSDRSRGKVHLLHGWGGSFQQAWVDTGWVERLAGEGYSVNGLQLMGHGVPDGPHEPAAYARIADLVAEELADEQGAIGIGYSLGAKLLLEIACRNPQTFRRLVLIGIGVNAFKPLGASAVLAAALRDGLPADAPRDLVRLIEKVIASGNDPLAMAACITRPQDQPITQERLQAVRSPTMVINGAADRFVLPHEPLIEALPDAVGVLLPELDHLEILTSPATSRRAISFID